MKPNLLCGVCAALALWLVTTAASRAAQDPEPPGAALYQERCAKCHDHPQARIPAREAIAKRTPEEVAQSLTAGAMRGSAAGLNLQEVNALAMFLTGKRPGADLAPPPETNVCKDAAFSARARSAWNGWGQGIENARYQRAPGFAAREITKLKVKWAFGLHGSSVYGQPSVVGNRLFVTSTTGRVYALDARTGCTYWTFDAASSSRTAMSVAALPQGAAARYAVFFGDDSAMAYALDAASGKLLWKRKLDPHVIARITGAPTYFGGRLYVPLSSFEEGAALNPTYGCCTFRGSVVALDAATGAVIWKTYSIADEPRPYRKTASGVQLFGPAGGAIWGAPAVDAKRKLIYVGTGNSYGDVAAPTTNALLALDMDSGAIRWARQALPSDNWVLGCAVPNTSPCPPGSDCRGPGEGICPLQIGPDADLGTAPMLLNLTGGKQVVVLGQKSGFAYGFDPDHEGAPLWRTHVGQGSIFGGIEWGMAADSQRVYAPLGNPYGLDNHPPGGLSALAIGSGEVLWHTPAPKAVCGWGEHNCTGAQSQAVTAIPGAVFSGSEDGHLRAYLASSGAILWDFDTGRAFDTVNGVPASGGSLDHGGPTVANGMLYVLSGYGRIVGQPGNLLLAFSVDGR